MRRIQGFTLIEMAMVLLIVALLIAAIFVGQSLIRSSHLTSVVSDTSRYMNAISSFHDKYLAMPGDFANAEAYWGAPAAGCPDNAGSGTQVCNGNGDGQVCTANTLANVAELHSEWVELANAELINGSFTYTAASSGDFRVGINTPASAIGDAGFLFFYATCLPGDALYTTSAPYNVHWLNFGVMTNSGPLKPALTGQEALNIDKKMDDGMPGMGVVRGGRNGTVYGYSPSCQVTATDTAGYSLATNDDVCTMLFALPN